MKKLAIALLALALLAPGALALTRDQASEIARAAVPGAQLVSVKLDDGVYETKLRGEDARYAVDVLNANGAILKIETVHPGAGGALSFDLSVDEARAAAAKFAPEAAEGIVERERGAQGCVYEVFYAAGGAVGEVAVNAQDGEIVRSEVYPDAANRGVLGIAAIEEQIEGKLPGAEIVEIELDWDGGRYVYEGEALANGRRYGFELNAGTGALLELERED